VTFRERVLLICVLGPGALAVVIAQLGPIADQEKNVVSERNRDAFLSLRVAKPGFETKMFSVAPPVETLTMQSARQ
jgi:hypothetical protein